MSQPATTAAAMPPPSGEWARPASEASIQRAAKALEANGIHTLVAATAAEAKTMVLALIPAGAAVFNATSVTLETTGVAKEILESGRWHALRKDIMALPPERKGEARQIAATPEWVAGSVHAITEDGRLVIASQGGSQLGLYAYAARHVVWVVGAQKIVKDLDSAFRRVQEHSLPLEDARARKAYGVGSAVNKMLIINHDSAGRSNVIIVRETLGF